MLNAYEAVFENGNLKWLDIPPNLENQKFQVIFLQKEIHFIRPLKIIRENSFIIPKLLI